MLKAGRVVIKHFAHFPNSNCSLAVGESPRHMQMKEQIGKLFPGAEYEVKLTPDSRADVVISNGIVVECQASAISIENWEARTKLYNQAGFPVMWMWDINRLGNAREDTSLRVPAEIRHCHDIGNASINVLTLKGELYGCHLQLVESRSSEWIDENQEEHYSDYQPKTLRYSHFYRTDMQPEPICTKDGLILVGLGRLKI